MHPKNVLVQFLIKTPNQAVFFKVNKREWKHQFWLPVWIRNWCQIGKIPLKPQSNVQKLKYLHVKHALLYIVLYIPPLCVDFYVLFWRLSPLYCCLAAGGVFCLRSQSLSWSPSSLLSLLSEHRASLALHPYGKQWPPNTVIFTSCLSGHNCWN